MNLFRSKRLENRAKSRLGIVKVSEEYGNVKKFRSAKLETFDKWYEDRAYNHLLDWFEAAAQKDPYIPIRARKPFIRHNLTKIITSRVASKLVGRAVFPKLKVEDDPETQEFIRMILKAGMIQPRMIDPIRRLCVSGSVLVRFFIVEGVLKIEHFNPNWCYPLFNDAGELISVTIKYVYEDEEDRDELGRPKKKWYRLDLGQMADVLFDNPEYSPSVEPEFQPLRTAQHNLGFVQAEWFRTVEDRFSPDGYGLTEEIIPFNDELNYSLSQSSQAVGYNQDPQLTVAGMDEDEVDTLIRSSQKGWNLGKDGKAAFLESNLQGVERAIELRDKMRLAIQDQTRVVLLDPEKIIGHAQSGRAMEILHGPTVELVEEIRPMVEMGLTRLVTKIALTILIINKQGLPVPITIPPGYQPQNLNISFDWPPIFPMSVSDKLERVRWVTSATSANILSRATGTQILAKDFGIEDVEEELQKISAEPIINPFGAF